MQNKAICPLTVILSSYHCRNCPSYHRYVLISTHSSRPPLLLMHNRPISKTRSGLRVYCSFPTPGSRVQQTTSLISTASRITTGCCTRMRILARYTPYTTVNLPTVSTGQDRRSYGACALTTSRLACLKVSLDLTLLLFIASFSFRNQHRLKQSLLPLCFNEGHYIWCANSVDVSFILSRKPIRGGCEATYPLMRRHGGTNIDHVN
jgi:hypothetical protein